MCGLSITRPGASTVRVHAGCLIVSAAGTAAQYTLQAAGGSTIQVSARCGRALPFRERSVSRKGADPKGRGQPLR